ncbi:pilus assembly protein PilM [Lysinibacillus contaminans]|uniref:Pilus assembly protein PilM n=1 Tax=Lysinibacillus contaminans TaxID=1293441 RepID=A0ABR5K302_9BACI|nr:pilus assembly protein PilM [Lysinibacillus contaminans]KOS69317.1 pilus assembly protein PilM [Lysinibacillus contaminans]
MFNKKKKSHISIEIKDYVLRAIVAKGPDTSLWKGYELPLERGIVEGAVISDEMALYEIIKEHVTKWAGKKQNVRMFVPDTSVLLKNFDHPSDVEPHQLKGYVEMELGQSIHLPFHEPLIDVYDPKPGDGQAMLYAAPSEEVNKMMGMFLDASLEPQAADIRGLCNIRLLEHMQFLDAHKTYLIADWSINELSISIFSQGNVEFLRYQSIETNLADWKAEPVGENSYSFEHIGGEEEYRMVVTDQVLEIDRMMNFFKFSLHKGEKSVDEIIILGDNPILQTIADLLSNNFDTPLKVLNDSIIQKQFPEFTEPFATLLGLALKEVN